MKRILSIISSVFLFPTISALALNDSLRVAILDRVDSCALKIRGYYQIKLIYTGEIRKEGKNLSARVNITSEGISLGKDRYNVFGIEICPQKDGYIYVNSRPYRGEIRLLNEKGKLLVINIISLEDYLKGVLNYEVAHWWPMQALMAQAVAARSYALYMKKMNKNNNYDLTCNVFTQVYGGRRGERWRIKRAIKKTNGLVLFYKGNILPAFYHSCCGGHTDNASHLWNINIPPLRGVPCNFCRYSPHYRWNKRIKVSDLLKKFNKAGYSWKNIDSISVSERYDTGYVKTIKISVPGEGEYLISSKKFREILGADLIRSRRFLLKKVKSYIFIKGYGWGHGIGLCQWGAYGMALKGYNFEQILQYYYPGAEIKKIIWDESKN